MSETHVSLSGVDPLSPRDLESIRERSEAMALRERVAQTIWEQHGLPEAHKTADPESWRFTLEQADAVVSALGLTYMESHEMNGWRYVSAWQDGDPPHMF